MAENGAITWTNERRKLRELIPWEHNPREIHEREAERLGESRKKFGQVQMLAIGPNDEIYDGHQRKLVWSILPEYGPDHEVEVRVSNRELTEKERQQLVIYLHKGTNAAWDFDELANSFEVSDLLDWGFDEGELIGWPQEEPAEDPGAQLDKAAELQEKWGVARGDIWIIESVTTPGKFHRVMCGDSTSEEDVGRLMGGEKAQAVVTDPPFNVGFDYSTGFDDARAMAEYGLWLWRVLELWEGLLAYPWAVFVWQAIITCCHWSEWIPREYRLFASIKAFVQFRPTAVQYSWDPVLFWSSGESGIKPMAGRRDYFVSSLTPGNWGEGTGHPCPRQPDVCSYLIGELCEGSIADPFLGSGTTLVACEQTGRIGYGMEIEPKYVSVTLERLAGMGLEPQRVTQ